jgi:hypothetical protein
VVAAVNFGDVTLLAGHRHASADYAPEEVSLLDTLRRASAAHGTQDLGASLLAVAVSDTKVVPIRKLYMEVLGARGFTIVPIAKSDFCRDRDELVRKMSAGCKPFLLAYPLPACGLEKAYPGLRRVVVLRYDDPCPANRDAKPGPSAMLLEPG